MVSKLIDWWWWAKSDVLNLKAAKWHLCTVIGHINTPPFCLKNIDNGWPRCRRCETTIIPEEHMPQDFWTDKEKYF